MCESCSHVLKKVMLKLKLRDNKNVFKLLKKISPLFILRYKRRIFLFLSLSRKDHVLQLTFKVYLAFAKKA